MGWAGLDERWAPQLSRLWLSWCYAALCGWWWRPDSSIIRIICAVRTFIGTDWAQLACGESVALVLERISTLTCLDSEILYKSRNRVCGKMAPMRRDASYSACWLHCRCCVPEWLMRVSGMFSYMWGFQLAGEYLPPHLQEPLNWPLGSTASPANRCSPVPWHHQGRRRFSVSVDELCLKGEGGFRTSMGKLRPGGAHMQPVRLSGVTHQTWKIILMVRKS